MAFGTAETAKLLVDLSLTGNFASQLTKVNRALDKTGAKLDQNTTRAYRAGQQIGTGIKRGIVLAIGAIGTLTAALAYSVKVGQEAANTQKIFANAVQNSYKTAADQTKLINDRIKTFQRALDHAKPGSKAAQNLTEEIKALKVQLQGIGAVTPPYVQALKDQQKALMNLIGVDDELVKSQQTRLIQMGVGAKAILKLTPLIFGASTATGKNIDTVTLAVGKAIQGNATALGRLGIVVDKTRFKADPLAETLRVLNQRFHGVNEAISGSFDTRMKVLHENLQNIAEEAGIKLLPALTRIVNVVGTKLVPAFGKFVDSILPSVVTGLDEFSKLLENGGAEDAIRGITDAMGPLVDLIKIAAAPVKAIVSAFLSLPHELQTVLIGAFAVNKLTGGLVTNIAGGIVETIGKSIFGGMRGGSPADPLYVSDVAGDILGGGGATSKLGQIAKLVGEIIKNVLIVTVAAEIGKAVHDAIVPTNLQQRTESGQLLPLDQLQWPFGPKNTPDLNLGPFQHILGGDSEFAHSVDQFHQDVTKLPGWLASSVPKPGPGLGKTQADVEALRGTRFAPALTQALKDAGTASSGDIEQMRGAISTGLTDASAAVETARGDIVQGLDDTTAGIETARASIAGGLTTTSNAVSNAESGIIGAIANKDLSIDQKIDIKVNVSAAGVTKSVTIQNRYGPGNGSSGKDLGGPNGSGGGVNSGAG